MKESGVAIALMVAISFGLGFGAVFMMGGIENGLGDGKKKYVPVHKRKIEKPPQRRG